MPATRAIAEEFEAVDIDVSAVQIEHAKRNVLWLEPGGRLLFTIEPCDEPDQVGNWLGKPEDDEAGFGYVEPFRSRFLRSM